MNADYPTEEQLREAEARLAEATHELEIAMRQGGRARTELMLENRDLRKRLAEVVKAAQKLMAAKGSYDCAIDPRVQREYEAAYTFIRGLTAEPKEK